MNLKLFGDPTPINWAELGVRMPFAPMHQLAAKYQLTAPAQQYYPNIGSELPVIDLGDILRTFELTQVDTWEALRLRQRIAYRTANTVAALDTCSPDSISMNIGGGYHHAGKYPKDGYAYSLINDIIWAVDYQLEQNKTIGIIDLDFHFGGGTYGYYDRRISIQDQHHPVGILHEHVIEPSSEEDWHIEPVSHLRSDLINIPNVDKILLNIGTDWLHSDPLFGKYGDMYDGDLLAVWTDTIASIVNRKYP
jgi:hypothetical protein